MNPSSRTPENALLRKLQGGDRRSIGRVPGVVQQVFKQPQLVAELLPALSHDDPVVRLRAGDVLEKVSRIHPEWLQPSRSYLLELAAIATDQEVRWHLAQLLPRLNLTSPQRLKLAALLDDYFTDASAIVRVSALQALADLAGLDSTLRRRALARVRSSLRQGGPAERARARKLLGALDRRLCKAPQTSRTRRTAKSDS
jgi:hypothetical protein